MLQYSYYNNQNLLGLSVIFAAMFSANEIENYYDLTYTHYKTHWKVDKANALHYGLWKNGTKNFVEALLNTNIHIIEQANIDNKNHVLDAGCGVGGTLNFIAKHTQCSGVGITLSAKQVLQARINAANNGVDEQAKFLKADFCETGFDNQIFDTAYAVESMCHATEKLDFLQEMYRVLKPGGKLVVIDFFANDENQQLNESKKLLSAWLNLWAIKSIDGFTEFENKAIKQGFKIVSADKVNNWVAKSARRLYNLSLLGAVPTWIYNIFKNGSYFGRHHYKSGIFQYQAFKKGYWDYGIFVLEKV